tara:strand:- start:17730 stop:18374 length:645 start_codon:yes stop_codon:yes gene_type:complete
VSRPILQFTGDFNRANEGKDYFRICPKTKLVETIIPALLGDAWHIMSDCGDTLEVFEQGANNDPMIGCSNCKEAWHIESRDSFDAFSYQPQPLLFTREDARNQPDDAYGIDCVKQAFANLQFALNCQRNITAGETLEMIEGCEQAMRDILRINIHDRTGFLQTKTLDGYLFHRKNLFNAFIGLKQAVYGNPKVFAMFDMLTDEQKAIIFKEDSE